MTRIHLTELMRLKLIFSHYAMSTMNVASVINVCSQSTLQKAAYVKKKDFQSRQSQFVFSDICKTKVLNNMESADFQNR